MLQNNLNFDQDFDTNRRAARGRLLRFFLLLHSTTDISWSKHLNESLMQVWMQIRTSLQLTRMFFQCSGSIQFTRAMTWITNNLMPTIVLTMRKTQCKHIFVLQGNTRFNLYITVNAQHLNSFKRDKICSRNFWYMMILGRN